MIDPLEVCRLLQRRRFGSIPGGDADGHGHVDGDGDGWLGGGLHHGPVVASLLQLSALGSQPWGLRDLGFVLL